jgi:excisionase family DNA binding protein
VIREGDDTRWVFTVEEAARLLGLGRNGCYEAVKRGEIPSVKIGRRLLVPRVALQAMLEAAGRDEAPLPLQLPPIGNGRPRRREEVGET